MTSDLYQFVAFTYIAFHECLSGLILRRVILHTINICDSDGARTHDPNIKSVVLYLLSYEVNPNLVRMIGVEPTRLKALDPKSRVSTNFTTSAVIEGYVLLKW